MDQELFCNLAPTSDADIECYKDAIDYAFSHPEIKNIAITGTYGSGKSSIIESYKKKNKENRKLLHLSLAHFLEDDETGTVSVSSTEDSKNKLERTIEGKLINQIIQQIPPKKIPLSIFRIKQSKRKWRYILYSLAICVIIALIILVIKFASWKNVVENLQEPWLKQMLIPTTTPISKIIIIFLLLLCVWFVSHKVIFAISGKNYLRKINIHGNEIEIFKDNDNSLFDKYLNEILYLLENADVDAIVFEDIDRFENTEIFARIREINTLINIRKANKGKDINPLRFFYMIRDDLFDNKDRTKFFDFIIPVIPVVDISNSYNMLKNYLEKAKLFDQFDKHFLRDISLYIDDLRVLKNIYNEFLIYKEKLSKIQPDINKLFAILTYKNIFPNDFSKLSFNEGYLHALFANKKQIIEEQTKDLTEKLKAIEERIQRIEQEYLESVSELDYLKSKYSYGAELQKWTQIYPLRKQAIEDKVTEKKNRLNQEKDEIKEKIRSIEHYNMSSLLDNERIDDVLRKIKPRRSEKDTTFDEIINNPYFPLLKYLVSYGYIDETYLDYTSIFYPNSISVNDKLFLRGVKDRKPCSPDYRLDSPMLVMENLTDYELSRKETLNYSLFQYIMNSKIESTIRTSINQVRQYDQFSFIEDYLSSGAEVDNMVKTINQMWPDFFSIVLHNQKMSDGAIKQFSYKTLVNSSEENLSKVNEGEILTTYISGDPHYLAIESFDVDKIQKAISLLDVSFDSIQMDSINMDLFDYVYENDLYKINPQNIILMLHQKCGVEVPDTVMPNFFSFVIDGADKPLCEYLWDNPDELFSAYSEIYNDQINDSDHIITTVLNSDLANEMKEQYVKRLSSTVALLKQIDRPEDQKLLVENNKLDYTIDNILEYYGHYGLDESLIWFINSDQSNIGYSSDPTDIEKRFIEDCVRCNELEDTKYNQIIQGTVTPFESFGIKDLSDSHIAILIDNNKIVMNRTNLIFLRTNYTGHIIGFICNNTGPYLELMKTGDFLEREGLELLCEKSISDEEKNTLVDMIKSPISIANLTLNDIVIEKILDQRFQLNDLPFLMEHYPRYSSQIKDKIFNLITHNIDAANQHFESIGSELLTRILENETISFSNKAAFLAKCSKKQNRDQLIINLRRLEIDKVADNLSGKYTKAEIDDKNTTVLNALYDAGIIMKPEKSADGKFYKMIRFASPL